MANSIQAIKRNHQNKKLNILRSAQRSQTRTAVKEARKVIIYNIEKAPNTFNRTTQILDRMADKSVIHKNKAARLKRRLSQQLKTRIITTNNS